MKKKNNKNNCLGVVLLETKLVLSFLHDLLRQHVIFILFPT